MTLRRIDKPTSRIEGRTKEVSGTIPAGVHPVLRRFWQFTRDMTKRFCANLLKDREEEMMKTVQKDFEKEI